MRWLNYHHLHYFWVVASEGGIVPAARRLHVSHPTLSAQIRKLEDALELQLFDRQGRRLRLTEAGRMVFRYAEQIFSLGDALLDAVDGRMGRRELLLRVGISGVLPKLVVRRLLNPILDAWGDRLRFAVREGEHDALLAALGARQLDLVLSDAPLGASSGFRAQQQELGRSALSFFAAAPLASRYRRRFPQSLDGAPMLLPPRTARLRRELDQWMEDHSLSVDLVAELADGALIKAFGQEGRGVFVMPTVVEDEIRRQYKVSVLGRLKAPQTRFYGIFSELTGGHPALESLRETPAWTHGLD